MNACIPIVRVSFVVQLLWPLYCVTCETSMQAQNPPPFITVAHASSTFSDRRHARCGDCPACQWLNTNGLVSLWPCSLMALFPDWAGANAQGQAESCGRGRSAGVPPVSSPHCSLVDAAWQRATEALHAPLSSAWHKRSEVKNTEVVTVARATSFSPLVWERARYQWPRGFFIIALLVHVCFITEVVLMNRYWRDSKDESILSIKPFNLI